MSTFGDSATVGLAHQADLVLRSWTIDSLLQDCCIRLCWMAAHEFIIRDAKGIKCQW